MIAHSTEEARAKKVADALSGRAGLGGVRWLLAGGPRRALRHELSALLCSPWVLVSCRLARARLRLQPDVKLTSYYDVWTQAPSGKLSKNAIAVMSKPKWIGDTGPGNRRPGMDAMEAEAMRRGLRTPFRRLLARVPAWGMRIQVSPLDPSFPQLVRVADPEHVRQMLESVSAPRAPAGAPPSRYCVTSIRYYPEQRHVLRYDSLDVAGSGTVFAKLYNSDRGRQICRVARMAAEWLAARHDRLTVLTPLACVPEDDVLLYPCVSGTPLYECLRRADASAGRQLERAGQALNALHGAPRALTEMLGSHSFEDEIAEIAQACDYIPALLPRAGTAIEAFLGRAASAYQRLPQEPNTFTHGDFKTEHAWVTPRGLTLIDFDTCHLADPALDLGKFLADLALWYDTWQQPGVEEAQERFLAGYLPGAPRERLVRARLFEALELVKITARRVPLLDRDWVPRTERLLSRAQALMNHVGALPSAPLNASRSYLRRGHLTAT
jgi:hypothetical protein